MSINFSDPNVLMSGGVRIPIDTEPEYNDALQAVTRIYADVGHSIGSGEINDMEQRIRGGQSLSEIVANTYDDAMRRFKVPDTPTTRAQEAAGLLPTYDAQLNIGRSFTPTATYAAAVTPVQPVQPSIMLEQLALPAREQAAQMNAAPLANIQGPTPTNTPRYNVGPAPMALGPGGYVGAPAGFGGQGGAGLFGGMSMSTILLIGGGILAVVLFLKAKK